MDNKVLFFKGQTVIPPKNTFIGGVSSVINTPALLAAKLWNYPGESAFNVANIQNFTIVGSDIECYIGVDFQTKLDAFNTSGTGNVPNILTSFNHSGDKLKKLFANSFRGQTNLISIKLDSVVNISGSVFFGCTGLRYAEFINAIDTDSYVFYNCVNLQTVNISKCTNIGLLRTYEYVFYNCNSFIKIYAEPTMSTINGGLEEGDLAYARDRGGTIRYVTNFTAPNAITDLAVTTVYGTAIKLSWTAPSSLNGVDYYEIYVNGVLNTTTKDLFKTIFNLTNLATYNFTVIAVDNFYNKSLVSNTVAQQINGTDTYLQSLLASYRFNSDLIDQVNANNGTGTAITYVAGKSGNAASFNGTTSFINTNAILVGGKNNFSVSLLFKMNSTSTVTFYGSWDSGQEKIIIRSNAGNLQFYTYTAALVGGSFIAFSDTLNWHHLVCTYNGTKMKMYLDGVKSGTELSQTGNLRTLNNETIGKERINFMNGLIDGFNVFNKELSQAEITDIYNIQNAGNELI